MTRSFALCLTCAVYSPSFPSFLGQLKSGVGDRDGYLLTGLDIVPVGQACSAKRRIDKMSLPVPRDFVSRP